MKNSHGRGSAAILIKLCSTGPTQRLDWTRLGRTEVSGCVVDGNQAEVEKGTLKPGFPELKKRHLAVLFNSSQIATSYRTFYVSLSIGGMTEDSGDVK